MERYEEGRVENDRAFRQERTMLKAIGEREPATLGEIAEATERGAPALSRAVDSAVKRGLVDRRQDPDNRRKLQLRLTEAGQHKVDEAVIDSGPMVERFQRLAQSELRAIERAIEILERAG
ncbi:MarR family winged helix-turn-helix transcriptional regulator [Sphingomicrobium clamense]|uniref:Winged helix DNA-binding protein n=1 Tax=Sphingomicrobium clamense TaxID=2851013 RepID=A0ABS6V619_9SPHN|nr:MarR family transcriptional regulator [Sphingomicrobium sp. B8]MBW0144518.1 winged helix DNA-binding protein [Sphingomicrobium sp. B8]